MQYFALAFELPIIKVKQCSKERSEHERVGARVSVCPIVWKIAIIYAKYMQFFTVTLLARYHADKMHTA